MKRCLSCLTACIHISTFSDQPIAQFYTAANVAAAVQGRQARLVEDISGGTVLAQQLGDVEVVADASEMHTVGAIGVPLVGVLAALRQELLHLLDVVLADGAEQVVPKRCLEGSFDELEQLPAFHEVIPILLVIYLRDGCLLEFLHGLYNLWVVLGGCGGHDGARSSLHHLLLGGRGNGGILIRRTRSLVSTPLFVLDYDLSVIIHGSCHFLILVNMYLLFFAHIEDCIAFWKELWDPLVSVEQILRGGLNSSPIR
mmetsp:Transcript_30010/g.55709  ORF Transcript_30010/g.55709 Transcript_30010/m.55709 type:complete len:256 (+) Transcript_30010:1136-1903(+)